MNDYDDDDDESYELGIKDAAESIVPELAGSIGVIIVIGWLVGSVWLGK